MTDFEDRMIKKAMMLEEQGKQFYLMAAGQEGESEAREAFEQLASEEEEHKRWLRNLYSSLREGKEFILTPEDESSSPAPLVFTTERARPESGSKAMSVFAIGVKMEEEAVRLYSEAAEKAESPAARELFNRLSEWEREHLAAFSREYQLLQEEWWSDQGFEPF